MKQKDVFASPKKARIGRKSVTSISSFSPFDFSFDESAMDEDLLLENGADHGEAFFSESSDEETDDLKKDFIDEGTNDQISRYQGSSTYFFMS